jgi:hypothetical protein
VPDAAVRALDPKDRRLRVLGELPPAAKRPEPASVIQKLIDADARAQGAPGFGVEVDGEFVHVFPRKVRDTTGRWTDVSSVLSTRISLDEKDRTLDETLRAITGAILQQRGVTIRLMSGPMRLMLRHRVTLGGTDVSARELLARALLSTGLKLTWRILYSPGQRLYALNILSSTRTPGQ